MNSENQENWERRLRELELEIDQSPSSLPKNISQPETPQTNAPDSSTQLQHLGQQVRNWFNGLPRVGKAIALVVAVFVGFSLLRTVLQLVSALIGMAILGVLLYAAYKFFVAPQSPQS